MARQFQFSNDYDGEMMRQYVTDIEQQLRSYRAQLSRLKPPFIRNINSASVTTYTLLMDDDDTVIANCTTAVVTVKLPAGLDTARAGVLFTTGKTDGTNNLVTDGNGATINGSATHTNSTQWKCNTFRWTGTQWITNP